MIARELLYALRRLQRSPIFLITAMLTLALGIGASTAVFTIFDSVILKPLRYRDSGSLVTAWEQVRFLSFEPLGPNPRHFDLWQQRSTAFSQLTLLEYGTAGLVVGREHPQLVATITSYPNLFETLQVAPFLGRTFQSQDGISGHDNVAVLTFSLWQTMFLGDMNVIGKTIRLNGVVRTIIGVLPPSFEFPNANSLRSFSSQQGLSNAPEPSVFLPTALDLNQFDWNGDYGHWIALGRVRPGVSFKQAESQLNEIEALIIRAVPGYQGDKRAGALRASVKPMQEAVVGNMKTALWLLLAAVIGLLLIACLNLANAQLGRAISQQGEAVVRSALGATRLQLLWIALAESLALAATGGVAGVLFAIAAVDTVLHYYPVDIPRLNEVHLSPAVLGFALVLTLGSAILFGLFPALRFCRAGSHGTLQDYNTRGLGNRQGRRLRTYLIGVQVTGCTLLLLVTGLFWSNLLRLLRENKGFDPENIVVGEIDLPDNLFVADQSRIKFIDRVLSSLRDLPGIQSAGLISEMPLEGETWIEDLSRVNKPSLDTLLDLRWVSPGYFEAMDEKLVAGRFFEERDRIGKSAVISEAVATALWRNENPLGSEVQIEGRKFTVVGVVADSHTTSLKSAPARMAYLHYADRPPFTIVFTVRGLRPASQLITEVRQAIWQNSPDIAIARIKTLESQVSDSLATERFETAVLVVFGVSALLLAILGIYAVLSYSVTERNREIAMRMALGASRREMYSLILREAAALVFSGLATGLITGAVVVRVVKHIFYGMQGIDLLMSAIVAVLFIASGFIAAFVPARRAASVNPMEVLRAE